MAPDSQGRQQKIFQGEGATKKRSKNSTIKPLSTIYVPCMKIQGVMASLPPLPTPMLAAPFNSNQTFFIVHLLKLKESKSNLLLHYSPYHAEACNEFTVPISATYRQGSTATCIDVEAVANRLQSCVKIEAIHERLPQSMVVCLMRTFCEQQEVLQKRRSTLFGAKQTSDFFKIYGVFARTREGLEPVRTFFGQGRET